MINVLVYNNKTNRMETYALELYDAMPYSNKGTLSVREFRGKSNSNLIWTTRSTMQAWNATRAAWGKPIYVGYAFRRIGEGGHSNQSQHYAGTSFDVGQNLSNPVRNQLRNTAASLGVWSYVEPVSLTPTWVHFDDRKGPPACSSGYPLVKQSSIGVYVALLQDALGTAGIPAIGVDGMFGSKTKSAVIRFQRENGLNADGVVGCQTWKTLTEMTNGYYRRNTLIPAVYISE